MRSGIGAFFIGAGCLALVVFGLWGLLLNCAVIDDAAGFWGVVIGFCVLPVTFIAAPWYAGGVMGNWLPLTVSYGGAIAAAILIGTGSAISGKD